MMYSYGPPHKAGRPARTYIQQLCEDMGCSPEDLFLRKYVTMDETWTHHFTLESNRLSAERTAAGESRSKRPKMQASAGKVLAFIFWDVQGFLFIDFLEKGKTINSEYYIALLVCLKEEIDKKRRQMKKKKVLFHQDNAPCHKSIATMANYINCTLNWFRTHPILQIWPSATISCLQTSKECSREGDLAPMKK